MEAILGLVRHSELIHLDVWSPLRGSAVVGSVTAQFPENVGSISECGGVRPIESCHLMSVRSSAGYAGGKVLIIINERNSADTSGQSSFSSPMRRSISWNRGS